VSSFPFDWCFLWKIWDCFSSRKTFVSLLVVDFLLLESACSFAVSLLMLGNCRSSMRVGEAVRVSRGTCVSVQAVCGV
jgi:hypothetical protein